MEAISTDRAPRPAGHYSQAVIHNGLVFVAGQLPIDPETGARERGPVAAQTRRVLENLLGILEAAGSAPGLVLKTTIYVADIACWGDVNAVYGEFFGDHRPARTVVPTRELHHGFQVEIDAIAAVPGPRMRRGEVECARESREERRGPAVRTPASRRTRERERP